MVKTERKITPAKTGYHEVLLKLVKITFTQIFDSTNDSQRTNMSKNKTRMLTNTTETRHMEEISLD